MGAFYHKVWKSGTSGDSSSGSNRISKNEKSYKVLVVTIDGFAETLVVS